LPTLGGGGLFLLPKYRSKPLKAWQIKGNERFLAVYFAMLLLEEKGEQKIKIVHHKERSRNYDTRRKTEFTGYRTIDILAVFLRRFA